jgi:FkbM family methyltransferase
VGNSKVWAFEPEQNNFNMLVSNLKLNGIQNVEPVKMAVGNTCGTAKLYISPTSDGMHSLLTDRKTKCRVQEVPVTTLDSYFKDKCEVNFLKTDTEGNDLAVLEGARNIIAASPDINVLFEFWLDGLEILNITASELLDRVHKLGLNYIYIINERRKCVEEATSDKIVIYSKQHGEGCNLLCSKQPYEYAKEN